VAKLTPCQIDLNAILLLAGYIERGQSNSFLQHHIILEFGPMVSIGIFLMEAEICMDCAMEMPE
jgi:hypothetical protein